MRLLANSMLTPLLCGLVALTHLPCGNAKALASNTSGQDRNATELVKSNITNLNSTTPVAQDTGRSNDTAAMTTLPVQTQSLEVSLPTGRTAVTHILRKKRETEVTMPFDFNTIHLPCDLDQTGRAQVVDSFPNHCVWVWNNKYVHEGFFRVFKTYQLEAFFFGQYYERLKRFELDPHSWDYGQAEV